MYVLVDIILFTSAYQRKCGLFTLGKTNYIKMFQDWTETVSM